MVVYRVWVIWALVIWTFECEQERCVLYMTLMDVVVVVVVCGDGDDESRVRIEKSTISKDAKFTTLDIYQ